MQNSNDVYVVGLAVALYRDCGLRLQCISRRDEQTIYDRYSEEGFTFLQAAFGAYKNAFLLGLETGRFQLTGWFRKDHSSVLPLFLRGWLKLVFCDDGSLRSDAPVEAVRCIYQFLSAFGKCETGEPFDERDATFKWLNCETTAGVIKDDRWIEAARKWVAATALDHATDWFQPNSKHGPGAVAEKGWGIVEKFSSATPGYPAWMGDLFGYRGVFQPGAAELPDSRLTFVHKDYRGPRAIAPIAMWRMFFQQSLMRTMVAALESKVWTNGRKNPLYGYINFTDQSVNGRLAQGSSWDRTHGTTDMREGSNFVTTEHVSRIFGDRLCSALLALRDTHIVLPNGKSHEIRMHAGMGSATCFPTMALVYCALLHGSGIKAYVYGDDIIVPSEKWNLAMRILSDSGLPVNDKKSFFNGYFRESCGIDAFKGVNITPVRLRSLLTYDGRKLAAVSIAPLVALSNQLAAAGFTLAQRWVESFVPAVVSRERTDSGLSLHYDPVPTLYCRHLQVPIVKTLVPRVRGERSDAPLKRLEFADTALNRVHTHLTDIGDFLNGSYQSRDREYLVSYRVEFLKNGKRRPCAIVAGEWNDPNTYRDDDIVANALYVEDSAYTKWAEENSHSEKEPYPWNSFQSIRFDKDERMVARDSPRYSTRYVSIAAE